MDFTYVQMRLTKLIIRAAAISQSGFTKIQMLNDSDY